MTEDEWFSGTDLGAMVKWFHEAHSRDDRLDRFAAAYYGRRYHHLSPQVLGAGTDDGGRQYFWFVQADDHDNQWAEPWDPGTGCSFLRCCFGDLFRPVALDPACLTPTAVALARGARERGEFAVLPILADALQDAGCNNDEILSHCRGTGPHCRACWVLDLVLGKE